MDISGKYRLIFWHKISMRQKLIETDENNEKPQKMIKIIIIIIIHIL